jgi:hypothetical protein
MQDRAERARDRGRWAGERARELRLRIARFAADQRSTGRDVQRAKAAADAAVENAAEAHRRAGEAHQKAAEAHEAAARLAQSLGREEAAARHRTDAVADREAAEVDRVRAEAEEGDSPPSR